MTRPATQICISTALMMEARAIAKGLGVDLAHRAPHTQGCRVWIADDIQLSNVGVRACRREALFRLWDRSRPALILMAGLGGALDPTLGIGNVVVDASGAPGWPFPPRLSAIRGRIATSDTVLSTPAEKAALRDRTGCVAVDMETDLLRDWARERAISFLAIRAISDRADESLDPAFAGLVDPDGEPQASRVAALLIRRPWLLPELMRLGKSARAACGKLQAVVDDVVQSSRSAAQLPNR